MVRIAIVIIVCVIALGVGSWYFLTKNGPVVEREETVKRITLRRLAIGSGKVESLQPPATLGFTLASRLKDVKVKEGDEVKEGQELALLDPQPFELEALAAESVLVESRAKAQQVLKDAAPEEIKQLEEKVLRAKSEVKKAALKLKVLQDPPPLDPAQAWQIQNAALEIEKARQMVNEAVLLQNKALEPVPDTDIAVYQAKVNQAKSEVDGAIRKYEVNKAKFGISESQVLDLEQNVERQRRLLEVAEADLERVKRGPSNNDKEAAKARAAAVKASFDLAVANKKHLENPPPPLKTPAWQIDMAQMEFEQSQSAEREAIEALALRRSIPRPEDIAAAKATVERAERAYKEAQARISQAILKAPYDGVVVGRFYEPGGTPPPYAPVVALSDVKHLRVRAEIPAKWASEVRKGQRVKLEASRTADDKFTASGVITRIADVIGPKALFSQDPSEARGGEVVTALIDLDEMKGAADEAFRNALRPGLRLEVRVDLPSKENVLCFPLAFLRAEEGKYYVMKKEGLGKDFKRQEVVLGIRDGEKVEVINGLNEGDTLVKLSNQK